MRLKTICIKLMNVILHRGPMYSYLTLHLLNINFLIISAAIADVLPVYVCIKLQLQNPAFC